MLAYSELVVNNGEALNINFEVLCKKKMLIEKFYSKEQNGKAKGYEIINVLFVKNIS